MQAVLVVLAVSSIKMPQINWITIFLLLTSMTVHTLSAEDVSHVMIRPTDSNSSICETYTYYEACDTLSNLISNNRNVFHSSSTLKLKFLRGIHKIRYSNVQLQLREKHKVELFGYRGQNAIIACETRFAFTFTNVEELKIRNLAFSQCGNEINSSIYNLLSVLSASLFLDSIQKFSMDNVIVMKSRGYGLFAINIHGKTHIRESAFLDNNKECSPQHFHCSGGNIALYFTTRANHSLKVPLNISITNCTIKGGSDLSENTSSCENRQERPVSPAAYKANGLAVIFAQENYRVTLHIKSTEFSQNIGNQKHPAVLVHDFSSETNIVEFYSNRFTEEGALFVSLINKMSSFTETVTIKSCYFVNGSSPGIFACIKSDSYSQKLAIVNSSFNTYRHLSNASEEAVIRISSYLTASADKQNVLVNIDRCTFGFNYIPSLRFHVNRHGSSHQQIFSRIVVKRSAFISYVPSGPTVLIKGSSNNRVPRKHNDLIQQDVNMISCTFRNRDSSIIVENAYIGLRDCSFFHSRSTAMYAMNSVVVVNGFNRFERNVGKYGGALTLNRSELLLMTNSVTLISQNTADYGGGIFAVPLEPNFQEVSSGIYSFCTINGSVNARICFENNRAHYGGYSLFGGRYVNCTYECSGKGKCQSKPDAKRFDSQHLPKYISIIPYSNDTKYTEVSSPATRICLCEDNTPTSECKSVTVMAFRGQEFEISLIATGLLGGSIPATLMATTAPDDSDIGYGQHFQVLSTGCTKVRYTAYSSDSNLTIRLKVSEETPMRASMNQFIQFIIKVSLSNCPTGYEISSDKPPRCICSAILERYTQSCYNNGTIQLKLRQWIGYFKKDQMIVAHNFPLDYLDSSHRIINLSRPDDQCKFSRNGILCGACQANLSMVLGTSNCKECSNVYLVLIIPFALAGVALVVLLLKCNLTVSVGHINGIIFYANIVQVNKALLFPNQGTAYQIFSTFIAWLNLDLGIETCFFEHMDSYTKVWLQFVFPVYLWIMCGLIILAARFSSRLERLIGSNSVPVLATLFLLSYAKLLRTIIAAMSFTFVKSEYEQRLIFWQQDGNLVYFGSIHIALLLGAVIFLFLYILPLTLLVLLAPCLQAKSHHKAFKWVNRLKPFLDAYQGPYSDKFRFWTGLLLILRVLLFIVYTSNHENDPSITFFFTVVVTLPLLIVLIKTTVYRHRMANWIELLSQTNIVMLCSTNWLTTATGYISWHPIREYATYISVAVIMLCFLAILLHQLIQRCHPNTSTKSGKPIDQTTIQASYEPSLRAPTSSVVELKECDQLRELLLDTN